MMFRIHVIKCEKNILIYYLKSILYERIEFEIILFSKNKQYCFLFRLAG